MFCASATTYCVHKCAVLEAGVKFTIIPVGKDHVARFEIVTEFCEDSWQDSSKIPRTVWDGLHCYVSVGIE